MESTTSTEAGQKFQDNKKTVARESGGREDTSYVDDWVGHTKEVSRSSSIGNPNRKRRHDALKRYFASESRSRSRERRRCSSRERSKDRSRRRRRSNTRGTREKCCHIDPEHQHEDILPVYHYKAELMQAVCENRVVVCKGETGSGKTTQFPQYLRDEFDPPGLVGVTQPRRVAAVSVATRVAEERRVKLGEEVGYQIRFEDCTGPQTRIKFVTDGCLVRECLADPLLSKYSFIMLDEAHERSVNTDLLFGLMKRALSMRPDLKLVVTSATLDVKAFAEYFDKCPVKEIPVRTHPVSVYHSKTKVIMTRTGPSSSAYVQSLVDVVIKIHRTQDEGHILAFLTGQDEIDKACSLLTAQAADLGGSQGEAGMDLLVLPLYGSLSGEQQLRAFHPVGPGTRKCIVATNIAETSVTVPGVRYVVDSGFVKQKTYNPARRMESLVVVPISRVAAEQRAGRAGRTGPGQCYRLYSRECLEGMMPETVPEICRCNLANVLLYLKVLGVPDVVDFDYFEAPSKDQLAEALLMLHSLGALDDSGQVTPLGQTMARLPLDPALSRAILQAVEEGCLREVLTIAAMLSVENIWFSRKPKPARDKLDRPPERDQEAERAHARFMHPRGDHVTYLMVFAAWEARAFDDQWAKDAFLSLRALKNARNIRQQLEQEVRRAMGLTEFSSAKDMEAICRALTAGFFNNAGTRCGAEATTVYKHMEGYMSNEDLKLIYVHPSSALAMNNAGKPPLCVIYHELVYTSRPFMRHVLAVERSWLMECRARSGKASVSQLSLGGLQETKESHSRTSTADATEGSKAGIATPRKEKTDQGSVAAARARFLARKEACTGRLKMSV